MPPPDEVFRARTWTSAEGLELHARDYPAAEGPARLPVVCLHGLTRNARDFELLAPWIADTKGRRVLALDVRGRGRSARDPAADYRLPAYAEDVRRLFDALGVARAVFVGTSMGGLITMELAVRALALVHAAIINDVGPELGQAGLKRIGGYVGRTETLPSWDEAAAQLRQHNAAALPHYATADWLRMARRLYCEVAGGIAPDYDPDITRPFADAPTAADPWARWRALVDARPVLLLRGELSDLLDRDVAARMATTGAAVTLREVPGVGHAPMLDEPAALAALDAFLDGLP